MGSAKRVIFALRPLGEPRKAAPLSQCPHARAPASQDFVRVCLMTDVPDQAVLGSVKDVVERDGELDDPETGTEVAARDGNRINGLLPQFLRELDQLIFRE